MTRMSKARLQTLIALKVLPQLPVAAQRVLTVLIGRASCEGEGWVAWPSQSDIADRIGANPRTVQRGISALSDAGVIAIERTQTVNRYWITVEDDDSTTTKMSHRTRQKCRPGHDKNVVSDTTPVSHRTRHQCRVVLRKNKSNEQEQQHTAAADEVLDEQQEAIVDELTGLPGKLQVDRPVAEDLARSTGISRGLVRFAVREVKARPNVKNPAGMLVSLLREPSLGHAYEQAELKQAKRAEQAREARRQQQQVDAEHARIQQEREQRVEANWQSLSDAERSQAIDEAFESMSRSVRDITIRRFGPKHENSVVLDQAKRAAFDSSEVC